MKNCSHFYFAELHHCCCSADSHCPLTARWLHILCTTSRWSISKLLCSVHTSLALLKEGGGEAETSSFWNLNEMLSVAEQRERQKLFWPISQFGILSFYSHSHVSSERDRRRFSALQQPWSCFHALPEGPLSVMLIWQWQMPTRRDYTFPRAPGTEPAMFPVILCPCWLIAAQQLFPRNPPVLIPSSCLSLVSLHLVACGFTSLLPVLYGSVPLKTRHWLKGEEYFVCFLDSSFPLRSIEAG